MYTKSDNVELRVGDDTNGVIKELFKSFLQRYQERPLIKTLKEYLISNLLLTNTIGTI